MKKLILVAVMALFTATTFAQDKGIKFTPGTMNEITAAAAKAKKMIFVDVYTTWCGPCKALSANIFPQESVGKYMNAKFVNAKFDAENGEGIEIAEKYKVTHYPTMLILDAQGNEVTRVVGSSPTPEEFIKKIETALAKAGK